MKAAEIGQLVMDRLKALDKVAYVRFASVYREFRDVMEFKQELESLSRRNKPGNTLKAGFTQPGSFDPLGSGKRMPAFDKRVSAHYLVVVMDGKDSAQSER